MIYTNKKHKTKNNSKNNLNINTHSILMYSILDKPTMDFLTRDNFIIHTVKK